MRWEELVGVNVRRLRAAKGLTQEALADSAGIAVRYVGGVERGEENPTVSVLGRLANALGVRPAQLLAEPKRETLSGSSRRTVKGE